MDLPGFKSGDVVEALVDENGTPLDKSWRDRLKDSVHDNCVTLVQEIAAPLKKNKSLED